MNAYLGLTKFPVPEGLSPWAVRQMERLRHQIEHGTFARDGAIRRQSNERCVPLDCFRDAYLEAPPAQAKAIEVETAAFLAEYRERMKDHVPSVEAALEMRNAFGPGETVINVITGQRFRT